MRFDITGYKKVFIVEHRVDFRRQALGLLNIAFSLNLSPFNGDLVIFVSRNKRQIRILGSDPTGLLMMSKVFTNKAFKNNFKFLTNPGCHAVSTLELKQLIEGVASF